MWGSFLAVSLQVASGGSWAVGCLDLGWLVWTRWLMHL